MPSSSFRVASAVVLVAAVGLALSATALAQPAPQPGAGSSAQQPQRPERGRGGGGGGGGGMGMFGGMMGGGGGRGPSVSKADVERIGKALSMDKQQLEAATLLHEAYVSDYEAYAQDVRTKMEDLRREAREAQDPAAWQAMGQEMRKAAAKRTELEGKFLGEMKDVLNPAQAERWPGIERMRTRERTIGMGMLASERVDVVRQVESLKLDESKMKELQPVLEQYAAELDRELKARNTLYESAQGQAQEILTSGDTAKMTKMIEDARAAAIKVREVNRRYARQVELMLPDDKREIFAAAVKRESYPAVYREGRTVRAIKGVQEYTDLTAEQKQAITTIVETHARELAGLQSRMERAQDDRETSIKPDEVVASFMGGGGGGGGGGRGMGRGMMGMLDTPELEELRTKRRELDTTTMDKVKALLTPEQKTRLEGEDNDSDARPPRARNRDTGEGAAPARRSRPAQPANQQS